MPPPPQRPCRPRPGTRRLLVGLLGVMVAINAAATCAVLVMHGRRGVPVPEAASGPAAPSGQLAALAEGVELLGVLALVAMLAGLGALRLLLGPEGAPEPAGPAASHRHATRHLHLAAPPAERRAGERVPMRCGAMLELPGRRATAVNLLDLSEGGAAVEAGRSGAAAGMAGALVLATSLLHMRVVAVEEGRAHLAFQDLTPQAVATIRRLLDGAGRAMAA